MRFCSLFSGSSGNCLYVRGENTEILIDAGVSGKKIETALASISVNPANIKGIVVTHEHSDHVMGVGILARRYGIPVFATRGTIEAITEQKLIGKMKEITLNEIEPGTEFTIDELTVNAFHIPHDAREPVGYAISCGNKKVTVATDMGTVTSEATDCAKGSNLALIETNHDISMLEMGNYPLQLKRRILGNLGHLSNEAGAEMIVELAKSGTHSFLIGHMSKENNYPGLAYEAVKCELLKSGFVVGRDIMLEIAERDRTGAVIEV